MNPSPEIPTPSPERDTEKREYDDVYSTPDGWRSGVSDTLAINPLAVNLRYFATQVKEDIQHSEHPVRTAAIGALAISTQAADRLRYGMTFVAVNAIDTFKDTQSIGKTGLVAGALFLAWNTIVGESLNLGISEFEKTKQSVVTQMPLLIRVLEETMPGVKRHRLKLVEHAQPKRLLRIRTALGASALALKRSLVGLGTGSTPFVGITRAQGESFSEGTKQDIKVGLATSVAVGGIGVGVAQFILDHADDPQLVKDVLDTVQDQRFWLLLAGIVMSGQYLANKQLKKKLIAEDATLALSPDLAA